MPPSAPDLPGPGAARRHRGRHDSTAPVIRAKFSRSPTRAPRATDHGGVPTSVRPVTVMLPLAAATGGYVLLPSGPLRDAAFAALGLACVVTAFVGLHFHAPRRQLGWRLVITGFLGWVVGDALFSLQTVWGVTAYPAPSDAAYLVAYGLMAAGLVVMVRRRMSNGDLAAVLDATILATGTAV